MPKEYQVDETDLKIIKLLEEDSKMNYREIADNIGVAVGTVHNRINNLKENDIIKKFTVDIDTEKLGYQITAVILMQIKGKFIEKIEMELKQNPHVYGIYDTTGDWDSIIIVKFKKIADLNKFLKELNTLENVERTSTSVCLNVVKENTFFPLPEEKPSS